MINESEQDILISRFLAGEASPEEAILLEDMIAASPGTKSSFEAAARIFQLPGEAYFSAATATRWPVIKSMIDNDEGRKAHNGIRYILLERWPLVAASVALLITIGILLFPAGKKHTEPLSWHTGALEQHIQLKDSSLIVLAPNSSLTLANDIVQPGKPIVLDGAASFSFRHDSSRSFIIEINKLFIKDIGTRFTVRPSPDKDTIVVDVQEGAVLLYDSFGSTANITAGEKALYLVSLRQIELYSNKKVSDNGNAPVYTNNGSGMPVVPAEKEKNNIPVQESLPGMVIFKCSACAGKGQLVFVSVKDSVTTNRNFMFVTSDRPGIYQHGEKLISGEYNWQYIDAGGPQTNGRILILPGQTKKIMLFGSP